MKSSYISTIFLLLPLFTQVSALTVPEPFAVRAFGGGFRGGKGGSGRGGAGGKGSSSVASTAAAATAAATTAAATTAADTTAADASATASDASTAAPPAATGTGANSTAGAGDNGDPQKSLTLDPAVISTGFENDGQDVPTAGQVASLTSSNNFINFCLTTKLPLTNGKQVTTGSCNTAPMGIIAASTNMPSSKFTNPKNGDTIPANQAFTITMAVSNFQTGAFVNAQENYFSAPQQVNGQGQIIGHSHVVVEQLSALDQTTTTDPTKFAFFKGLNSAAVGGVLSADVTSGLPAGVYKVSSINTAANHQPCLVAIAQHGSLDDAVYFTVADGGAATGGGAAGNATAAAGGAAAASTTTDSSAAPAATTAAATPSAAAGGKTGGKGGKGKRFI